jgi:hypothetical protein
MDTPLWQTVLGTLAALGGGGVVIFGFSGFLGKVWADRIAEQLKTSNTQALERIKADFLRDVESYKVQLKKSEFLFQKQFEAASELVALKRRILPRYNSPYMDMHEACEEIAHGFGKIEVLLNEYLASHGAVLPVEVRDAIVSMLADAGTYKFEVGQGGASDVAIKAAGELMEGLQNGEQKMVELVHGQSSL